MTYRDVLRRPLPSVTPPPPPPSVQVGALEPDHEKLPAPVTAHDGRLPVRQWSHLEATPYGHYTRMEGGENHQQAALAAYRLRSQVAMDHYTYARYAAPFSDGQWSQSRRAVTVGDGRCPWVAMCCVCARVYLSVPPRAWARGFGGREDLPARHTLIC